AEPEAFLVPPPPAASSTGGKDRETSGTNDPPRPRNGFRSSGGGKRRSSCGTKQPAWKRRRRAASECGPVLPSEFLLGGNIFDPLNLNSLLDEEVSRALNARTPQSSPLPARGRDPVEILVPRDITDPLSLNAPGEGLRLASPAKSSRRRHRHRGQQRASSTSNTSSSTSTTSSGAAGATSSAASGSTAGASSSAAGASRASNAASTDEPSCLHTLPVASSSSSSSPPAAPPALPAASSCSTSIPSASSSSSSRHRKRRRTCSKSEPPRPPPPPPPLPPPPGKAPPPRGQRRRSQRFQFGNYSQYYGYRNPDCEDGRLRVMRAEWFTGKEVLDVGCNVGHLTLSIAKRWGPSRVVGLDIDGSLIHSARQNIRHYLSEQLQEEAAGEGGGKKGFPTALLASRGPIAAPRLPPDGPEATDFPHNVVFVTANYVPEREEAVAAQRPEFDVVLCLSLTKLNWGDEGLKRLFRRLYRHLRPGGLLLLEPQPWASYRKRKGLT
ncbi:MEPCE enzyme, partial [Rhinopomastus cyanomelas]|nr:MEPCE enzyme [Rhinopomastus cyanomelas]